MAHLLRSQAWKLKRSFLRCNLNPEWQRIGSVSPQEGARRALVFLVMAPFSDHFKMDAYVEMPASVPEQPGEQLSEEPA
ncbi:hypothetical protein U0070_019189 [Myodes glareolus]|uniref:Uncharacterized protein n=1 Tax=Myodes glareolus TaxID=447135 RepID=A0AAW0H1T8_MYOGA